MIQKLDLIVVNDKTKQEFRLQEMQRVEDFVIITAYSKISGLQNETFREYGVFTFESSTNTMKKCLNSNINDSYDVDLLEKIIREHYVEQKNKFRYLLPLMHKP